MRVLVSGGTGYVGAEVVASLASAGHSLRVLVHAHQPTLPEAVEAVPGDISDAASLEAAAAGCDAIVNLVAILDGPDAAFEAVNAGGPRNVVAAARANGIRRVVHMSALGVTAEHAPLTRYWGSKYAGKQAVTSSDLDWTVLEPSFVFGRGGGALKAFESLIRMPLAPVIGNGRYRHQPVWAGDVATAFVRALERPQTSGKVIPLGGPQVFTFDELLDELARVTGRAPRRCDARSASSRRRSPRPTRADHQNRGLRRRHALLHSPYHGKEVVRLVRWFKTGEWRCSRVAASP